MYGAFHVAALYLFCLNSERIFFVIFITYACHNFIIAALPIMGMWPKCWQTERSSCTSRTNMGSNWTNPNSLIQNTWAQYSGRQPSPTLQKSPLYLNWRLRWRVGKQIGTETLANKCPQNPGQCETWAPCPHRQSQSYHLMYKSYGLLEPI